MSTDPLSDARIVDAWHKNTSPWTRAVRGNEIESRTTVTNQAIVDAVEAREAIHPGTGKPASVIFLAERSASA